MQQTARQHKEKSVSSTFVTVNVPSSSDVLGYYAVSLAELVSPDLPAQHRKRLPLKVPAFRLDRLATSVLHRGQGIGEHLLLDAIARVTRITSDVGGVGLVVNAKPGAVEFYRRYGFEPMADHPLNLFLPP